MHISLFLSNPIELSLCSYEKQTKAIVLGYFPPIPSEKCGQRYFMSAFQKGSQLQTCKLAEVFQCVYVGEMPTQIYPGNLVHRPVGQHSPAE